HRPSRLAFDSLGSRLESGMTPNPSCPRKLVISRHFIAAHAGNPVFIAAACPRRSGEGGNP
ncbi:MAG: hypothetical protein KJO98_13160, partial [Rhodothermia bacterium]|nr:hypothetical protein [Rhodothermia bacterium]